MRKLALLIAVLMTTYTIRAQRDLTGEYFLEGVMETASGFLLKPDSTFEFYFSYGALDRSGKGTWTIKDGMVVLDSKERPAKDFALLSSKTVAGKGTTVKMVEKNTVLLSYIECTIRSGTDSVTKVTDGEGIASFDARNPESISLLFQLCPDRPSVFSIDDRKHNYFEFRFEPWIAEVFFSGFVLAPDEDGFRGKHPLLGDKTYAYVKQTQ